MQTEQASASLWHKEEPFALSSSRRRAGSVCWTLGLVSLVLLAVTVYQVAPLTVEPNALFGLASYLPPAYWIGLTFLFSAFAIAFFTNGVGDLVRFFLLILMGVYLLGLGNLVEPNARMPETYYPVSEVGHILDTGHLNMREYHDRDVLVSYRDWPAIHFVSAAAMMVLGVPVSFVRYVPFLWVMGFILATWAISKRVGIRPSFQFLLPALGLASWWTTADYFSKDIGIYFYLLLLLLMVNPRRNLTELVLITIIFSALVITHALTSVVALLLFSVLALYRRELRLSFLLLFIALFALWFIYFAHEALVRAVFLQITRPLYELRLFLTPAHYATDAPVPTRVIFRSVQLAFAAFYVLSVIVSAVIFIRSRMATQSGKQILTLFLPLPSYLLLLGSFYGELVVRLFFYGLVPVIAIILLTWRARLPLIALLAACMAILPVGRYALEASWGQVTTPELWGSKFMASKVASPNEFSNFHTWSGLIIYHYNPDLITAPKQLTIVWYPSWNFASGGLRNIDLSPLSERNYVILSKQGSDADIISYGYDPFQRWTQTTAGRKANLIYDNAPFYQVYRNSDF